MVGNWWYKRKGGDSTRKKKSKIENKNLSFEALFSRKSTLNFRSVRVHFIASRCNGSHCRSLSRWILSQFVCFCRNGKLGIHNEIIWSNHKVYYYKNYWKCCPFCRTHTNVNVEEQILKDVLEHPDISARNLSLRYNLSCFIYCHFLFCFFYLRTNKT